MSALKATASVLVHHHKDVLMRIVGSLASKSLPLSVQTTQDANTTAVLQRRAGGERIDSIEGSSSVSKYLLAHSGHGSLLGSSAEDTALVADWTLSFLHKTAPALAADRQAALDQLNSLLAARTFVVGSSVSLADLALFSTLYNTAFRFSERLQMPNVIRYYDLIQHIVNGWGLNADIRLVEFDLTVPFVAKPATDDKVAKKAAKPDGANADAAAAPATSEGSKKKSKQDASAVTPAAADSKPVDTSAAASASSAAAGSSKAKKPSEPKPDAKASSSTASGSGSAADESLPDPSKLDIRVGTIISVKRHPDADTLYVEEVDLGEDAPRTVVSGLVKWMPEDHLLNRRVLLLCNLKPAKMRGIESQAMVLAATSPDGTAVELLDPPAGSQNGDAAYFEGYQGVPEKQLNSKKKVWESIQPNLLTDDELRAVYIVPNAAKTVCPLKTAHGVCTVKSIAKSTIK